MTNILQVLSKLLDIPQRECIPATETWDEWPERVVESSALLWAANRMTLKQITLADGTDDWIMVDICGFPTLPVRFDEPLGHALWGFADGLPLVNDTVYYSRPRPVKELIKDLPAKLSRVDLKHLNTNTFTSPRRWDIIAAGVMKRLVPGEHRSLYEVDMHGIRVVVPPKVVGISEPQKAKEPKKGSFAAVPFNSTNTGTDASTWAATGTTTTNINYKVK
jgi:hypothetical protein|tara:strand:+ start:394 stop:1053 length:660 start_codon:yes stop_codon:yes gene_type:complete